MCGIAGIVSDNDENDIADLLKQMLGAMKHRGPDGAGIAIGGICERKGTLEDLNFEGKKGHIALGHVRLAITGGSAGVQPFQSPNEKITLLHNGEIYNHEKLRAELKGVYDFETDSDSEVILGLLEQHYHGDLESAVKEILPKLDGVYALAITDNNQTVIARDKIGVRQLYIYNNDDYIAFASEKKAFMPIAGNDARIHRLLPGHMATIEKNNVRHFCFWSPDVIRSTYRIGNQKDALAVYGNVLHNAVRKRIAARKHVGIIFSGGVDSLLLAYIVQKLGVPFTCYTAGRQGSSDLEWASSIAQQFKFPLKKKILTLENIERLIPQVIKDIEDHSLNQVEVSIPIYAAVRMAQEAGELVILTGQGADELFGGYSWYAKIVEQEGYKSFEQYSWKDTVLLYKECLEREDKISMAHSMELRVPYLDPEVIKVAFQISPELKIQRNNDQLGKRIHRQFATSIGISEKIAFRKKEAAQHGANIHSALEELARQTGVTDSMLTDIGYDPDHSVIEKLGSSSRYGFRYGDHHLWKPQAQMQYYLDSCAAVVGFLPPAAQALWDKAKHTLESEEAVRS